MCGKTPPKVDVRKLGVDILSASVYKFNRPKDAGFLYKTTIDEGFAAFQKMNRAKKQEDDGMPYISPPKPKLLMLRPVRRSAA